MFKRATVILSSESEPTLPAVMLLLKKVEGLLIEQETDAFLTCLTLNSNVLQRLRSVYGPEILEEAKVSVFLSEFQWLMDFDGNKLQPSL
jgi:hypothetical protein